MDKTWYQDRAVSNLIFKCTFCSDWTRSQSRPIEDRKHPRCRFDLRHDRKIFAFIVSFLLSINYLLPSVLHKSKLHNFCFQETQLIKVTQGAIQRELLLFASFTRNFHQRDLFPCGKRWFVWHFAAMYINAGCIKPLCVAETLFI